MQHASVSRRRCFRAVMAGILGALLLAPGVAAAAESWSAVVSPENSLSFSFLQDQTPVCGLGLGGWGPNWSWVGLQAKQKAAGGKLVASVPFVASRAKGDVIDVKFEAWKSAPREVSFRYDLSAGKDVPLTMLIAGLSRAKGIGAGQGHAVGRRRQVALGRPAVRARGGRRADGQGGRSSFRPAN